MFYNTHNHKPCTYIYIYKTVRKAKAATNNRSVEMAAVIDLCALDTVESQTISSRTSIILNWLPLSPLSPSPISLSRLKYIQSPSHPQAAAYVYEKRNTCSHFLER